MPSRFLALFVMLGIASPAWGQRCPPESVACQPSGKTAYEQLQDQAIANEAARQRPKLDSFEDARQRTRRIRVKDRWTEPKEDERR